MKSETVLLLRKLAREATIFALLGMVLAGIGAFVVMDNEDRTNTKRQAEIAVQAGIDFSPYISPPVKPSPTVQVPLTNGTILQVRRCEPPPNLPPGATLIEPLPTDDCRSFSTDPLAIRVRIPLGNIDQIAIEKDYWTAYKEARHRYPRGDLLASLFVSLLGFPAGLVLWVFYRLLRFAVKG